MPFALNFYHDQVDASGKDGASLPEGQRILYVRHGSVDINGRVMKSDEASYSDGPVTLKSASEWAQVWRWELALPNTAPSLLQGEGVLSSLRMARVISTLAMLPGTRWLLRLDQIS